MGLMGLKLKLTELPTTDGASSSGMKFAQVQRRKSKRYSYPVGTVRLPNTLKSKMKSEFKLLLATSRYHCLVKRWKLGLSTGSGLYAQIIVPEADSGVCSHRAYRKCHASRLFCVA